MAARGQLFVAFAVLGGAFLPFVRQAEAAKDKHIVLLDIEGERSPRLKKSIARMVKEQYQIMEGSSYRDAARRLRAEKLIPVNVKKVCAYLEVDGVIDGTLVKEDGRYKFTLRLRSAVSGAIAKKIPMYINQPSLSQNMADQLEERLLAAIADLPRPGGGTKIKARGQVADDDDDEDSGFGKKKGKKAKAADDEEDEDEEEAPPKKMSKAEKKAAEKKAKAAALAEKKREEKEAREEAAREKKEREKAEKEMARKKKKAKADDDEEDDDADADDEEVAVKSKKNKGKKAAAKDEDEEDDDAEDEEKAADEDEEEPKRAAMRDAGDQEEDADNASNPDLGLSKSADKPTSASGVRTTPLLINAGMSFVGRNLAFKSSAPADVAPRGYQGKTVPGVYATGELYPMSFAGAKGALANIGVGFVADRVIKLNSSVSDGMDGTVLLPTKQSRYGANLRYRHNFGSGPRGVSVMASVGYNKLTFSIDKSGAPDNVIVDVPNTAYTYVDPGLGVRVPIAGAVSALVEGKFLAVLGTGEIQQPEQYGAATVTGFDGDAALEYALGDHFLARAGARLMYLGYSFKGNGEQSDRDGNGSADVGGASDRYLGGYVTAGYAF